MEQNAKTEPKVWLTMQVTRADGTVEPPIRVDGPPPSREFLEHVKQRVAWLTRKPKE